MQYADKVVLVTGAQQGIGRAMAIEFALAGADVAINWLDNESAAESAADQVRSHGRRALTVQADVARVEQTQAMVTAVVQGLGPIDVLINNAGIAITRGIDEKTGPGPVAGPSCIRATTMCSTRRSGWCGRCLTQQTGVIADRPLGRDDIRSLPLTDKICD